jgi:hypothetical protein
VLRSPARWPPRRAGARPLPRTRTTRRACSTAPSRRLARPRARADGVPAVPGISEVVAGRSDNRLLAVHQVQPGRPRMPSRAALGRSDLGRAAAAAQQRCGHGGLGPELAAPGLSRRARRRGTVARHGREPRRLVTSGLREPRRDLLVVLVCGRPQGARLDQLAVVRGARSRRDPRGCRRHRRRGGPRARRGSRVVARREVPLLRQPEGGQDDAVPAAARNAPRRSQPDEFRLRPRVVDHRQPPGLRRDEPLRPGSGLRLRPRTGETPPRRHTLGLRARALDAWSRDGNRILFARTAG